MLEELLQESESEGNILQLHSTGKLILVLYVMENSDVTISSIVDLHINQLKYFNFNIVK